MPAFLDQTLMILGWVSAFFGAGAYLLASRGTWDAKSFRFNLTNVTAAALMVVVAGANGLWPSVAANLVWVVIGTQALWTITRDRRRATLAAAGTSFAVPVVADGAGLDFGAAAELHHAHAAEHVVTEPVLAAQIAPVRVGAAA